MPNVAKETFIANMNALNDAISLKCGTTAKRTITEMTNAVQSIIIGDRSLKKLLDSTKSCYYLFNQYRGLAIPEGTIEYNDTSNVTNMNYMFYFCVNLTTIPPLDTSNVTNMISMFMNCTNLTSIPELNTNNVTSMSGMFDYCTNLTSIPELNTINVTSMSDMFYYCTRLTTIPELNTSKVTSMHRMFNSCRKLITIPLLDMISVTSCTDMFTNCQSLTNLTLLNIQTNLQIGNGTSWGHLLTLDSLINTCKECIKQSESRTLTVGTANLEKLANVYVKFANPSQTEIAVGEKGDIVVCESTDEGAMLISDYMTLKSWTLA